MQLRSMTVVRVLGATVAAALIAPALTGCAVLRGTLGELDAQLRRVTYEVSVTGKSAGSGSLGVSNLSYLDAPTRGRDTKHISSITTRSGQNRMDWSADALVRAGHTARVAATPVPGATAKCRILVDGGRELASSTAATGKPVVCEVKLPKDLRR
ncbi:MULTISPECIES: hypothetical protein [unclassified Leucobacter]|uniref:hypothetical protein n=1 Tax=unclassified Leucobacter TaxID=2621730 RepID=UPI00069A53A5|nr:hypothetical protein [Leucobacter sp. Ag1]